MYKSIFSLSLSFLLVCLAGFTTPGQAQISVTSSGKVMIGTTSGGSGQPRLYVRTNQGNLTHNTAIRGHASAGTHFGLLAQEVEKVFPELVRDVVSVLELQERVEVLEAQLNE